MEHVTLPKTLLPALIATAGIGLVGCMGAFGTPPNQSDDGRRFGQPDGEGDTGVSPISCPIDPDCNIGGNCSLYECPDYWICEDQPDGKRRCVNPGPDYPDDGGGWRCEDAGDDTICRRRGDSLPDDGGGNAWNCELAGEFVVCTNTTPDYPDEGGGGAFNCWFSNEFRICETTPDDPEPGDGGGWSCFHNDGGEYECRTYHPDEPDDGGGWACWDGVDEDGQLVTYCRRAGEDLPDDGGGSAWNCELSGEFVVCSDDTPDYPDDGGGGDWDCRFGDEFRICTPRTPDVPDDGGSECVPGVQRWCDDDTYCSWGKQTCLPDGTWGTCIEPRVTSTGLADRPDTACGCRFFYFNDECCEDQEDRDGDGNPDCLIPSGHTPPACTSDGGLCSYCDAHSDCGGANDVCVFRRDGYAMCGQDCSSSGCPTGYACTPLATRTGTIHQCVRPSGSCE